MPIISGTMRYLRDRQPGGCYFFTVVTGGRRRLLTDHIDALRIAISSTKSIRPFEIDAIVILPDHLHTIWRLPEDDSDYSTRWMLIKRQFSLMLPPAEIRPSLRRRGEKGIWQRRFWEHRIRDEQDWRRHMDYIHLNPVKHRYCESPADWPYSSFHRLVRRGFYEIGWGAGYVGGK